MDAIIEIGTNSLKLLIYRTEPNFEAVVDKTIITRLSEGYYQTGEISISALNRNIEEINESLNITKIHNCRNTSLYGTMIFRSAKNTEVVLKQILEQTGLNLKVLSGKEEAEYSFLAATYSFTIKDKNVLVIDSGGGSTEFIFGRNGEVNNAQSLNVGAVTLTDKFKLQNEVKTEILEKCERYLNDKFKRIETTSVPDIIIGIGGTVTTISAIIQKLELYSAEKVQGSIINLKDISKLEKELSVKNLELSVFPMHCRYIREG
jgi:exopolyphosphatase/guanosine-5'-triphosphate,3'-diphosphate pyrophosphatase